MNRLLSRVLKGGLYLSLAVVALGLILLTVRPAAPGDVHTRPVGSLLPAAVRGDRVAILDLGLVLLMLTPVARVVAAIFGFAAERNRRFTWISAGVLAVLVTSFVLASLTGVAAG